MPVAIKKGNASGALSMTPLIDVVFLLLIFFLVATRFEQEERDMDVALPKATDAKPTITRTSEIYVSVTPQGELFVDGQTVDLPQLESFLSTAYQNNPGKQKVTIRADKDSRTRHVVAVMNACQRANIKSYSIAAE